MSANKTVTLWDEADGVHNYRVLKGGCQRGGGVPGEPWGFLRGRFGNIRED